MHVEVKYPVGTVVWARVVVRHVELKADGLRYTVQEQPEALFNSLTISEEALQPLEAMDGIRTSQPV